MCSSTVLAKTSPHILSPERFALHIGTFFVSNYAHIHKVHVTVTQLRWSRIAVDGKEHKHSFYRDGDDRRVIKAVVRSISLSSISKGYLMRYRLMRPRANMLSPPP